MGVLLFILKILGYVLAALLLLVLLLLCVPVRYRLTAGIREEGAENREPPSSVLGATLAGPFFGTVWATWLFGVFRLYYDWESKQTQVKILFFDLFRAKAGERAEKVASEVGRDNLPAEEASEVECGNLLAEESSEVERGNLLAEESPEVERGNLSVEKPMEADRHVISEEEFLREGNSEKSEPKEKREKEKEQKKEKEKRKKRKEKERKEKKGRSKSEKKKNETSGIIGKMKEMLIFSEKIVHYPEKKEIIERSLLLLRRLFRAVKPKQLQLEALVGFDDPSLTGYVLGVAGIVQGLTCWDMQVQGNFEQKMLHFHLHVKGRIVLGALAWPVAYYAVQMRKHIKIFLDR